MRKIMSLTEVCDIIEGCVALLMIDDMDHSNDVIVQHTLFDVTGKDENEFLTVLYDGEYEEEIIRFTEEANKVVIVENFSIYLTNYANEPIEFKLLVPLNLVD